MESEIDSSLKIGDRVKFCRGTFESIGNIIGEIEDGRSAGVWIVECPDRGIKRAVFYKDDIQGKHFNVGNWAYWIVPIQI